MFSILLQFRRVSSGKIGSPAWPRTTAMRHGYLVNVFGRQLSEAVLLHGISGNLHWLNWDWLAVLALSLHWMPAGMNYGLHFSERMLRLGLLWT
jgi:hypothetical protein